MSLETMTKLATTTVGVGGSSTITFSNIPQGYTDLVVRLSTRTTASGWTTTGLKLTLNGSSASVYTRKSLYNTAAGSMGSDSTSSTTSFVGGLISCGASSTSGTFGNADIRILNYSENLYKSVFIDCVSENNGTDISQTLTAGTFADSSPITSLTIVDSNSGSFVQNSTFVLYGIKNVHRTAGNSIKATGGIISFDGTYVSHKFISSDTFTPTQVLNAEYIVVAGGGGGGTASDRSSGAGGAGGYRSSVAGELSGGGASAEAKLTLQPNSYAVVIGAGGSSASAGSSSTFASITSTGGGSGSTGPVAASIGGSGGGGSGGGNYSSGVAGTTGQGYAGGNGYNSGNGNTNFGGGGGGGAGAKGNDATGDLLTTAGNGGIGVLSYISGAPVYYAGGGGGGSQANSGASNYAAGTGGLGGGGNGAKAGSSGAANGSNGTTNTGGGGGGAVNAGSGGTGGSGIVIIRYKG